MSVQYIVDLAVRCSKHVRVVGIDMQIRQLMLGPLNVLEGYHVASEMTS
jgi:hypothetical protein